MRKPLSILLGSIFILVGLQALLFTVIMPFFGLAAWSVLQLWPVIIISIGALFVVPPMVVKARRGLGGLFIPGLPILATGLILLWCSVFDLWHIWEWVWPVEILALGLGFLFAGARMRVIWLVIPASIFWFLGLAFQFSALTGIWEWWSVFWAVVPFSVGMSLLLIGIYRKSSPLMSAGKIICGATGLIAALILLILSHFWTSIFGAMIIILVGVAMLIRNLTQYTLTSRFSTE